MTFDLKIDISSENIILKTNTNMKKSKFLQRVGNDDRALYYHSLFGRLFLLDRDYISVLESENPIGIPEKEGIITDLIDNGYLVDEAVLMNVFFWRNITNSF